jgi:hypothetical protein
MVVHLPKEVNTRISTFTFAALPFFIQFLIRVSVRVSFQFLILFIIYFLIQLSIQVLNYFQLQCSIHLISFWLAFHFNSCFTFWLASISIYLHFQLDSSFNHFPFQLTSISNDIRFKLFLPQAIWSNSKVHSFTWSDTSVFSIFSYRVARTCQLATSLQVHLAATIALISKVTVIYGKWW